MSTEILSESSAPVHGKSGLVSDSWSASKRCKSASREDQGKGNDVALPRAPMRWLAIWTMLSNGFSLRCFISNVEQIIEVMQTLAHTISTTVTLRV